MRMYVVMRLTEEVEIRVDGVCGIMPLSYVDGMVGAIPVFETKESADKFAGDKYKVVEVEAT